MVRKKSTAAKAKTRNKAYERKKIQDRVSRSWRKLLLIVTAVNKFLRFRRCDIALACLTSDLNKSQSNKIFLNNVSFVQKDIEFRYVNKINATSRLEDLNVVQATIKSLVSKVCRRDYERKRQLQNRKRKHSSNTSASNMTSVLKCSRQCAWFQNKYSHDSLFRKKESTRVATIFQNKYTNNIDFREKQKAQLRTHVLEKYRSNTRFQRSKSYLNKSLSTEKDWICKTCSDKIKKGQMPSRAIVNKLEVSEIPSELKRLNNLEKHLIALRLPLMKIVNLTSGKLSSRFAQKGTKGPLHCVPSDVQDTVTILPRP
ncbi:unnamed protein product, partial [Rotaria sp. Silwood2]